jgi:uncharacterized protein YyaL (SSP411 family)/cytochrome c biogenesis protein CcdA
MRKIFFSILISFILIILLPFPVRASSQYTRERSEALFHLINWHDYSPKTFTTALDEQKPILLIISAPAWCYWCHVYESEDYLYHPDLYPFINEYFIPIFIDSDRRPDLTKKYLEGGWPSTTIFTPDFRRISGFTGPQDPQALRSYFEQITAFLKDKSFTEFNTDFRYEKTEPIVPEKRYLSEVENAFISYITRVFDPAFGGFILTGSSETQAVQKFPFGFVHKYLLEQYAETGKDIYLTIVQTTFDNQFSDIRELETGYRLYDPVEGGFHRYSTQRDWTKPHYEKMLADQAKLIRAYAHLFTINRNSTVKTALDGSVSFVLSKFYDGEGAFYSSQDAYLEEGYYGLPKGERDSLKPPYIDRTRIMDANSMMINTFLYLYETFGDPVYADISRKSLDFIRDRMIGGKGAFYYYDEQQKKPSLTGQSIANSWAMLAFLNGSTVLGDERYRKAAVQIARFSLDNLYDWDAGGFFERNSKDIEFYAPYEGIELSKPFRENAVFSFAMIRLFLITGEPEYLESGLKTLGFLMAKAGQPDEMYYFLQSSRLVLQNNLTEVYQEKSEDIEQIIRKGREDFFLHKLFSSAGDSSSELHNVPRFGSDLAGAGFIILSALAFLAGILSFLSPCTLPVLSAYFAQGFQARKGKILIHTVFFFFGLATVFSVFGMGATYAGSFFRENRILFTQIAGIVIILFGILEIFGKGFSGLNISLKGSHTTPVGSYLFGGVFALGWSACTGPILASLLLLSATTDTVVRGTALLFIYSLGLAVPLILTSLFFDRMRKKGFWEILRGKPIQLTLLKKHVSIHSTQLISGIILIVLGGLIFNDLLYRLNQLTFETGYVQNLIVRGEEILQNVLIR